MSIKTNLAILVSCALFTVQGAAFRYSTCRRESSGATAVAVDVCATMDEPEYCPIKRASNLTFNVDFETVRPFQTARLRLSQNVMKMSNSMAYQTFNLFDACEDSGLSCPSRRGDRQRMRKRVIMSNKFLTGVHEFRFELLDEAGRPILCKEFLADFL